MRRSTLAAKASAPISTIVASRCRQACHPEILTTLICGTRPCRSNQRSKESHTSLATQSSSTWCSNWRPRMPILHIHCPMRLQHRCNSGRKSVRRQSSKGCSSRLVRRSALSSRFNRPHSTIAILRESWSMSCILPRKTSPIASIKLYCGQSTAKITNFSSSTS